MLLINRFKSKKISVLLIWAIFNLIHISCSSSTSSDGNGNQSEATVNSNSVANVRTNNEGFASINSDYFDTIEFKVKNKNNNALEEIDINYYENKNSVFIEIVDPSEQYGSIYLWGDPNDLPSGLAKSIDGNNIQVNFSIKDGKLIFTFTVVMVILTAVGVGVGVYQVASSFQKIDKFWTTDVVYDEFSGAGVVKTIPEIAELMKNQIGVVGGIFTIGLSFLSAGTASTLAPSAWKVGSSIAGTAATIADISGFLLELIKEHKLAQWEQDNIDLNTEFLVQRYSIVKGGIDGDPSTMPGFDIVRPWDNGGSTSISAPTLTAPADYVYIPINEFFEYRWTAVSNADQYEWQMAPQNTNYTDSRFTTNTSRTSSIQGSWPASNPMRWRVRAIVSGNNGPWSNERHIITDNSSSSNTIIDDNFSTNDGSWTEYDPDGKIVLDYNNDRRLEFTDWKRSDEGFVQQNISSTSNFVFEYDINITADGGNANQSGPCIADRYGSLTDIVNANGNAIFLMYYAGQDQGGSAMYIYAIENGTRTTDTTPGGDYINISIDQTYYVKFEKNGNALTLNIYSDQGKTNHISGSPKSVTTTFGSKTFNNFYALNSFVSPSDWEWTTGWIDNIKLIK